MRRRSMGLWGVLVVLVIGASAGCDGDPGRSTDTTPDATQAADALPTSDVAHHDSSPSPDTAQPVDQSATDIPEMTPPAHQTADSCAAADQGTAWEGWANLQHPRRLVVAPGTPSEPIYGQVWRAGDTEANGQAVGWEAELLVGPLGTTPGSACWRTVPASFNIDAGNNDEYWTRVVLSAPGLYGMVYRFRPPGGAWKLGDANGSDDGIGVDDVAVIEVLPAQDERLVLLTLNLRCRADDWPARRPLVLAALIREAPDFIAFQEDCSVAGGGPSQSSELREDLAATLERGYASARHVTHQADHGGQTFDEGVALLSARDLGEVRFLDLPFAVFPRVAVIAASHWRAEPLQVASTHFDFGVDNEGVRVDASNALLDALGAQPAVLMGDLNAEPTAASVGALSGALDDLWDAARPGEPGHTMPAHAPTRRIDYVFASQGLGPPGRAELVDDQAGGIWLSDHLGLVTELTASR